MLRLDLKINTRSTWNQFDRWFQGPTISSKKTVRWLRNHGRKRQPWNHVARPHCWHTMSRLPFDVRKCHSNSWQEGEGQSDTIGSLMHVHNVRTSFRLCRFVYLQLAAAFAEADFAKEEWTSCQLDRRSFEIPNLSRHELSKGVRAPIFGPLGQHETRERVKFHVVGERSGNLPPLPNGS